MKFDIVTIFPQQIKSHLEWGLLRAATGKNLVEVNVHDLRNWTDDPYRSVDDHPYGGGAGMVMKIEPVYKAVQQLKKLDSKVILFTPRGKKLEQKVLREMAEKTDTHYILLCGHYEGFDQRIHDYLVDIEVSIGDYVLSGGELPALVLLDGISRLLPGALGNEASAVDESFEDGLLEYPQYTRPEGFIGWNVPTVLLTGNHQEIKKWRRNESVKLTKKLRPDLL